MSVFSDRLVKARKNKGITQKELAKRLNIGQARLNYWEKGKREPDTGMIILLSRELQVNPNYLLGIDEKNTLTAEQQKYIDKYKALDEISSATVNNCIDFEYAQTQKRRQASEKPLILKVAARNGKGGTVEVTSTEEERREALAAEFPELLNKTEPPKF